MLLKTERKLNINNIYDVEGLIFYTKEDYLMFKNIDKNITQIVKSVKDGIIDINEVFNDIEKIRVLEFKYNAGEKLFDLFKNATELLEYEGTDFDIEYKVGCRFYAKFLLVEYSEFDNESENKKLN